MLDLDARSSLEARHGRAWVGIICYSRGRVRRQVERVHEIARSIEDRANFECYPNVYQIESAKLLHSSNDGFHSV